MFHWNIFVIWKAQKFYSWKPAAYHHIKHLHMLVNPWKFFHKKYNFYELYYFVFTNLLYHKNMGLYMVHIYLYMYAVHVTEVKSPTHYTLINICTIHFHISSSNLNELPSFLKVALTSWLQYASRIMLVITPTQSCSVRIIIHYGLWLAGWLL